ncbi:peptidoglycan-binding protein [Streptomyces cinerochromogenes]|uniref:Peptidoglycan-binding protein n=1 Tax=Streptomyces cinerochromogenes TaxID=66422 RepID=A0ABW7AXB3_9ACTN
MKTKPRGLRIALPERRRETHHRGALGRGLAVSQPDTWYLTAADERNGPSEAGQTEEDPVRRNDANPERTPASGPDIAQEIRDSFQAVLDALDAARTDLLRDEQPKRVESPSQPQSRHGHPTGDARFPQPTPPPSSAPASSASGRALAVRRVSPGTQPERPEPHRPTVAESLPTGGLHQAGTPHAAVPEPPVLPQELEAVPPPSVGEPPSASGPGQDAAAPTVAFATQAPCPEGGRSRSPRPDKASGRRLRFAGRRDLRVYGLLALGAASGLILASWLLTDRDAAPATSSSLPGHQETALPASPEPKAPSPRTPGQTNRPQPSTPDPPLPVIPGTGVLRQGDSGHGVYELQVRLQQIPDIYDGGAIDGRYDAEVGAAVALFQKRYGVRGDESGVYGDNTRFALMLRTK